jgi:hypothetical protein
MWRISDFALKIGVSESTLKRWDKSGSVRPRRLPNGHRYYTIEDVLVVLGISGSTGFEYREWLVQALPPLLAGEGDLDSALLEVKRLWAARCAAAAAVEGPADDLEIPVSESTSPSPSLEPEL